MIKIYTAGLTGLLLAGLSFSSLAQSQQNRFLKPMLITKQKFVNATPNAAQSTHPGNTTQSFWDVRFQYDVLAGSSTTDLAGVVYAKGKFWVSRWQTANSIATFDSTGEFIELVTIPGIGAVRSLTTDGEFIYGSNVTANIQVIDPVAQTKVRQFSVPPAAAVGGVRWITYNPAGNSGAGSFFVGNYATAISQIDKPAGATATLINAIPATVHGLAGMYGVAYEENGADSKFWVYNQGDPTGGAGVSVVVVLDADGGQTGLIHDSDNDFGSSGTAGGVGFGLIPGFTTPSLYCMAQGNGLIGYDTQLAAVDISAEKISTESGLVAWPAKLGFPASLKTSFRSLSTATQTNIPAKIVVRDLNEDTVSQTVDITPFSLGSLNSSNLTTALNTAALHKGAVYEAMAVVSQPNDEKTDNDTAATLFALTDSTLARDFSYLFPDIAGSIGIGAAATQQKALGAKFSTPTADTLTSVSFLLKSPFEGQTVSASLYRVTNTGTISTLRGTTGTYTVTSDDEANGVLVTLPFTNPFAISAGQFFVAVNELGDSTAGLGRYALNYQGNTFYIKWTGNAAGAWTEVGTFGANFQDAFAIYPNFGKALVITATKSLKGVQYLNIAPNPTTGVVRVSLQTKNRENVSLEVTNSLGQKVTSVSRADFQSEQIQLDLSGQKPGVYFVRLAVGNQIEAYPVVLTH